VRSPEVSPKELPERSTSITNEDDYTRRHLSGIRIKAVRSPEVSPEELPKRSTKIINEDDSPRHLSGSRVKVVRSSEELPEKSTNITNENNAPRDPSGIKIKSVRSPEEQPESNIRIGLGNTKQPRSSTNLHFQRTALLEANLGKKMNRYSRTQSEKTVDESERSRSRTKEPNSMVKNSGKVKNSDKRKKPNSMTTGDGVDHHCRCIVM
jgi:hypothetical protein